MLGIVAGIAREIWKLFADAAPYIIFGLVVAGLMEALVKREQIARHLGSPGLRSVVNAALIGIPLPLCSCGVLPTAMALKKNGASKGATVSFLIATPESGIDSIAISYALLDPLMTVFRPLAALASAVIAGICENLFGVKEPAGKKTAMQGGCVFCELRTVHTHPIGERLRYGIVYAFTDLLCDLSKWLAIGIACGGIISYFVPESLIGRFLGYSPAAFLISLAAGIPMYICASASTPIAAALIAKGMSPGAALVFLLVGPATNTTSVLAIGKFLGKRSAAIYLLSLSTCALLSGALLNALYISSNIDIRREIRAGGELVPEAGRVAAALVLLFFMVRCQLVKHAHCEL